MTVVYGASSYTDTELFNNQLQLTLDFKIRVAGRLLPFIRRWTTRYRCL